MLGEPLFFFVFRQLGQSVLTPLILIELLILIWNLESSSLVNAVFGVVDFLEFLLGCTAHIFA